MKGWLRRWGPRLLGVGLSVAAVAKVGQRAVWDALAGANLALVLIAAVAVFPLLAPKARRWQGVLAAFGIALPWRDALRFYSIGLWAAVATPGQVGDVVKAWYVRGRGAHLAPALASVVVDRLFDVLLLLLAAAFGVAVYGGGVSAAIIPALTLLTIAGLAVVATPGLRRGLARALPANVRERLAAHRWTIALRDAKLSGGEVAAAFGWSLVGFAVTLARVALCFAAVGVHLAPATLVATVGLSSLVGLLSISGIGTRDVFLIAALGRDGVPPETALAASFLILFLNLSNVVPGFVAWLRDPVPLKEPHPPAPSPSSGEGEQMRESFGPSAWPRSRRAPPPLRLTERGPGGEVPRHPVEPVRVMPLKSEDH